MISLSSCQYQPKGLLQICTILLVQLVVELYILVDYTVEQGVCASCAGRQWQWPVDLQYFCPILYTCNTIACIHIGHFTLSRLVYSKHLDLPSRFSHSRLGLLCHHTWMWQTFPSTLAYGSAFVQSTAYSIVYFVRNWVWQPMRASPINQSSQVTGHRKNLNQYKTKDLCL